MQLQCVHQCKDRISSVEWSSDSLYILCAMHKRGLVEVWSIEQPVSAAGSVILLKLHANVFANLHATAPCQLTQQRLLIEIMQRVV